MKKIIILLAFIVSIPLSMHATHLKGGEITWRCLQNGQYQFYMEIYRECAGASFFFNNQTLSSNSPMSSITMKPDSNRWLLRNNGNVSPKGPITGCQFSCETNPRKGVTQFFPYKSDPVTLNGVPPASGWEFYWSLCCRPPADNLANPTSESYYLRAIMYSYNNQNANPCFDSSPRFQEMPTVIICKGYDFVFNHNAADVDLDSLVYRWAQPQKAKNTPVNWKAPYTYNNPTPGPSANPQNKSITLDDQTGEITFGIYSGADGSEYTTCIQVDAYKCGKKVASVFRDLPFILFDCPPLPGIGLPNNPPKAEINGIPAHGYVDTVYAGEKITVPFQSIETDLTYDDPNDPSSIRIQQNTLAPSGFMFSNDFTDPNACAIKGIEPCATLTPPPVQNLQQNTGQMELTKPGSITTVFEWQTDCKHISLQTACTSTGGRYNFVMKTYDDHCNLPAITYPSLSIRVLAPPTAGPPEIRGVSVELDGSVKLIYKKPPKPNETLARYMLAFANTGLPSTAPTFSTDTLQAFDRNVKNIDGPYNTKKQNFYVTDPSLTFYWEQDPTQYFYFRMNSYSGCGGMQVSPWSDHVRVPRAVATHVGPASAPSSKTKITWDLIRNPASTQLPSAGKTYRVWVNYPVNTYADIQDTSNWKLLATTKNQEYTIQEALTCTEPIAVRVEMFDTLSKGNVVSFFTSLDTFIMAPEVTPPKPVIDSVSVDINGDVYIGITPGRPALKHEIYDVTNGTPGVLVGTIWGSTLDTLLGINGAANNGSRKYTVKAFDECEVGLTGTSDAHNTIYIDPATSLLGTDTCAGNMILDWNAYVGWPTTNNTVRYDVLVSKTSPIGPYTKLGTTANTIFTDTNAVGETDYWYKIIARDDEGHRSTSAIFYVNHGEIPSREVVPAPHILCTRVLADGKVEVEWETPRDSTNNRLNYVFEYNANGNWVALPAITDTAQTMATFGGFNANKGSIKFRARTFSDSCNNPTPSRYGNIAESIYLDAVYQVGANGDTIYNAGEVFWNSVPIDSTELYAFERRFENFNVNQFQLLNNTPNVHYVDPGGAYCDTNVQYRVRIQHPNGCYSISNIDQIKYLDNFDPNMQPIDYISYDKNTGELIVKWSIKPQDSPDVDSVALIVPDPTDPTQFDEIMKVAWEDKELRSMHPLTDASFEVKTVTLQAIDKCGRDSKEFDVHSTIDIDAGWDTCAKTFTLNWNAYETFRTPGNPEYTIYYSEDGINFMPIGNPVNDTVYTGSIPNLIEAHRYYFYVKAKDQDGSGIFFSDSNVDSIITLVENMPEFTYLRTATVNSPNQVQVDGLVDEGVAVARYNIYRGNVSTELQKIGSVLPTEVVDDNFTYLDNNTSTDELSYYYKIQVESPCGNFIDTSNFGRTIHLTVTANRDRISNILKWNEYEGWDSAAAYYNIYRGVDGAFDFITPYETVYPESPGSPIEFVDDVSDEAYALGQFCYTIEAVEGNVRPELASYITSANSKSNYACADAEPLFYIPNAFSPSGVNKVFRPEGQFVNFAFYEMIVYNRWGEKVFETREFFEGWDGTYKGEPAQDGTYIYTIRFKGADGREHSKKGTVTLIN